MESITPRIDHAVIFSSDPPALLALLSETLQLPVVWPMLDFGGYASGGVNAGNLNLEVTRGGEPGARLMGMVFASDNMAASLAELDRRGLRHSPPGDYAGDALRGTPDWDPATPPGARVFTSAFLDSLPGPGYVAVCDYNYAVLKPMGFYAEALRARDGGPLGVTGVREIRVGVTDPATAAARWQTLLDPAVQMAPGRWALEAGPALVFVPAARDSVQSLVLQVRALDAAERFLRSSGLLGAVTADSVHLAPERVQGLDIRLVQD